MKIRYFTVILAAVLLLGGCASNTSTTKKSTKLFSSTERNRMFLCVSRAEAIRFMASSKLRKVEKEKLSKLYKNKKFEKLNLSLLDLVYKTEFKDPWIFSLNYFKSCSVKNAGIPTELTKIASYCALNTFITGDVYFYKKGGLTAEQSLAKYKKLKGDGPRQIVERVYASDEKRGKQMATSWNICMDKIAEK